MKNLRASEPLALGELQDLRVSATKGSARPFGDMFRAYRFHRGLTVRELAKEIGTSSATLCRMEMGKDPDVGTMLRVLAWMFGRRIQ